MNAHPIIDPDDGPAYANLTHDHKFYRCARRWRRLQVGELTFRWQFVLTLPKAVDFRHGLANPAMWSGLWPG